MRGRWFVLAMGADASRACYGSDMAEQDLEKLFAEHLAILAARYAAALAETGWESVLLHSGTPKSRSIYDDQYFPLRPTPFFQHWLPLVRAESGVLVEPGKKPTL